MTTMNEYQVWVQEGKIYPQDKGMEYVALGLCGESGEFAEKVKKWLRDGTRDLRLMALEVGDILWYVAAAAGECGYTLQEVVDMTVEKLESRRARGTVQGSGDER